MRGEVEVAAAEQGQCELGGFLAEERVLVALGHFLGVGDHALGRREGECFGGRVEVGLPIGQIELDARLVGVCGGFIEGPCEVEDHLLQEGLFAAGEPEVHVEGSVIEPKVAGCGAVFAQFLFSEVLCAGHILEQIALVVEEPAEPECADAQGAFAQ